jgi:hypothetical protein
VLINETMARRFSPDEEPFDNGITVIPYPKFTHVRACQIRHLELGVAARVQVVHSIVTTGRARGARERKSRIFDSLAVPS